MAQLYIEVIANALSDYHRNVLVGDYNYLSDNGAVSLKQFYTALAWQGLKNNNVQAYTDLSTQEKQILEDTFNQYYPATTSNCPD